jgi:hypothetical protein
MKAINVQGVLRDFRAARALNRCRLLAGEVYTPQGVEIWLHARNKHLGSKSPVEMILEGFGDLAVAEAERLASL